MATNVPPKTFDVIRYAITAAAETPVVIPGNTVRKIVVQCVSAADIYLGFTPNATFSANNYWTIKSGQNLPLEDVAMQPSNAVAGGGSVFYLRGSASVTVEVLYAQG